MTGGNSWARNCPQAPRGPKTTKYLVKKRLSGKYLVDLPDIFALKLAISDTNYQIIGLTRYFHRSPKNSPCPVPRAHPPLTLYILYIYIYIIIRIRTCPMAQKNGHGARGTTKNKSYIEISGQPDYLVIRSWRGAFWPQNRPDIDQIFTRYFNYLVNFDPACPKNLPKNPWARFAEKTGTGRKLEHFWPKFQLVPTSLLAPCTC